MSTELINKARELFKKILICALLLSLFAGCAKEPEKNGGTITLAEARTAIAEDSTIVVLDVRTSTEHLNKRIDNSISLPDFELEEKISTVVPDKDAKIFVYCASGKRSASSVKLMTELGYTNVYDIGGIATDEDTFEYVGES